MRLLRIGVFFAVIVVMGPGDARAEPKQQPSLEEILTAVEGNQGISKAILHEVGAMTEVINNNTDVMNRLDVRLGGLDESVRRMNDLLGSVDETLDDLKDTLNKVNTNQQLIGQRLQSVEKWFNWITAAAAGLAMTVFGGVFGAFLQKKYGSS